MAALHKLYGGPRLSDGTQVYAGLPVGGEALRHNWDNSLFSGDVAKGHSMFAVESFRWMVYGDPDWEISRFDIDHDYPQAKARMAPIMDSDNADLSAFIRRGGKLLLYHGWNDAAIPAGATVNYYTTLRESLGPVADEQVRLVMAPGMMHCGGGVGPTDFDMLYQMDRWVESGAAPERIVATEYARPPQYSAPRPTPRWCARARCARGRRWRTTTVRALPKTQRTSAASSEFSGRDASSRSVRSLCDTPPVRPAALGPPLQPDTDRFSPCRGLRCQRPA